MERTGHEDKSFFVGPEVEHTPAYSKKTLFVISKHSVDKIAALAREHGTPHIFMGANHSFECDNDSYWNDTITALLNRGFWVSLDYPAHQHKVVLEMLNAAIWQSRTFVPLLRVEIPKVLESSLNLTVKIDDVGFAATNPGVWCMSVNEVTDSNRFTDWIEYGSDTIVGEEAPPVPAEPVGAVDINGLHTVEVTAAEEIVQTAELNPQDLGLDIESESKLKPEVAEILAASTTTPVLAAEAYADGAKEDPLSKEASKKPVKKSKSP